MIVYAIKNGNELETDNITLREKSYFNYKPKIAPELFMISPSKEHLQEVLEWEKSIDKEETKNLKIVKVKIEEVEE